MYAGSDGTYEYYAHKCREQHIHKGTHEFFGVGAHLLQNGQGLAAALVFKLLVGEAHSVLQPISEHTGTKFLGDDVQEIVLEILGDAADHGHGDAGQQQRPHAGIGPAEIPEEIAAQHAGIS